MNHNIGVIGLGKVFTWYQKAINKLGTITIVGLCDKDPKKVSLQWNVPFFTNPAGLLKIKEIDTIVVAVPPKEQYSVARACLEAGKHVLLEKPGTQSQKELEDLYAIADRTRRKLVIALHASFGKEVVKFVSDRRQNPKHYEHLVGFSASFFDPYVENGVLAPHARALGGSWLDSAVNSLSVIAQFIPLKNLGVFKKHFNPMKGYDADVGARVQFNFETKTISMGGGFIETSWTVNVNKKTTRLYFVQSEAEQEEVEVELNHSEQTIKEGVKIQNLSEGEERLTAHYLGVLNDYFNFEKWDNRELTLEIHKVIADAR